MVLDDEFNPYAAPKGKVFAGPREDDPHGYWADGKLLIVRSHFVALPDRCIKCNLSSDGWVLPRKYSWLPQAWIILIFISWPIFLIVWLIVKKTAKVGLPLCEEHRSRRRRRVAAGWLLALFGIGLIVAGFTVPASLSIDPATVNTTGVVGLLVGLLTIIVGLVVANNATQVLSPTKIDKQFAWLKGAGAEFLATLPPWVG